MNDALRVLLNALDATAAEYGEIHDTVVREHISDAVFLHFIQSGAVDRPLKESFGMFTEEANVAVRDTVSAFVSDPAVVAFAKASTPRERLDAFQNASVTSDAGATYDDYAGHLDIDL
ncbi:MAG: hypothetical protein AAGK21_10305 [Bacteroidota bacterium]